MVLYDAVPFLGAWFALVPWTRIYLRPGWGSLMRHWALAIPLAVLIRQLGLGRPFDRGSLVFLPVALGFTGLFLAAGRVVATLLAVLRRRANPPSHNSL